MRVVEPNNFRHETRVKKRKRVWSKVAVFFLALAVLVGAGYTYLQKNKKATNTAIVHNETPQVAGDTTKVSTKQNLPIKSFTGEEFKTLYRSIAYPNVQSITEPIPITSSSAADARIRQLAEARGYRTTSIPVQSIDKISGFEDSDNLLQPLAYVSWQELKAAAAKDGIPITIISAYRSPEYQRNLFLSRLMSPSVTIDSIAAGKSDAAVEATLHITAVPGYSRHHTGYTVDFWCEDGSGSFAVSTCFQWLNSDNYKNAKEHGWIPSYPEGANEQGPEPEPWEYVWVGRDTLT